MSLHPDQVVDAAMRANIGAGFHFFDPDTERFHKSRSVYGCTDKRGKFAYVVLRFGAVYMGTHCVQTPHSRVYRVQLTGRGRGETEDLTETGKPIAEMVKGVYVKNGERGVYATNARAIKAARAFAGVGYRETVGA